MAIQYYNGSSVLSSGCPINFSIGNRSTGKSYYWKRYCIKQFLTKGRQFVYLRRNKVDLDMSIPVWWDDISHEFTGYGIVTEKNRFYIGELDDEGKLVGKTCCGYYYSMAQAGKLKSMPLERVDIIFFDEFLPEDGRYLHPGNPYYEPEMLLSIYMTVARGYKQVVRPEVKFVCVANMISIYNPYFSLFNVDLTGRRKHKINGVYAEIVTNDSVSAEIRKTQIGKILETTGYGAYALDNVSQLDDYGHIYTKLPRDAHLWLQLYLHRWYQCWHSPGNGYYWQAGYDKHFPRNYRAVPIPGSDDKTPMFDGDVLKMMKLAATNDYHYYKDMQTKNALMGLLIPAKYR